eukprot:12300950-Ditylum_brightwellii.AAC.1
MEETKKKWITKLHIDFAIFSDDFDPSSEAKSNRNNVWICSAVYLSPCNEKKTSANTFVVSMSKKGENHNIVFKNIAEEIEKINDDRQMFYVKVLNKYVHVHLDLVVMHVDSPEFYDTKHLSCGNSMYTSFRVWLLNAGEVWSKVQSCENCYKMMLQNGHGWKRNVCQQCVNWVIGKDSLGLLHYSPPEHYPSSMINNKSNSELIPQKSATNSSKMLWT